MCGKYSKMQDMRELRGKKETIDIIKKGCSESGSRVM